MKANKKYGFWSLNIEKSKQASEATDFVLNCSACGHEITNVRHQDAVCPECGAIMVDPLDWKDVDGNELCAGDEIVCNILGYKDPVRGKIVHDTMWYFDNPVSFRFMYDCKNIQKIKGIIPEGEILCRDYENIYTPSEEQSSGSPRM